MRIRVISAVESAEVSSVSTKLFLGKCILGFYQKSFFHLLYFLFPNLPLILHSQQNDRLR